MLCSFVNIMITLQLNVTSSPTSRYAQCVAEKAFFTLLKQLPGMSWDNRLMMYVQLPYHASTTRRQLLPFPHSLSSFRIVPDDDFVHRLRGAHLEERLNEVGLTALCSTLPCCRLPHY